MRDLWRSGVRLNLVHRCVLVCFALLSVRAVAAEQSDDIKKLEQRIEQLERLLDERVESIADLVEQKSHSGPPNKVHIGGYGEMHFNVRDNDEEDLRELDFHRFVLFFGFDFSESVRLVSELEVEHTIASAGNRGAVELEQAYIEFDLKENMHLQSGILLMPIGIINETHEPPTFYGVERPIVETVVIPSTWYNTGIKFSHSLENGIHYDFMLSEGLKTEDPYSNAGAEPFDLKKGKQKGSFAAAYDFAYTTRVAYTGIAGLTASAYVQYQSDIDQSAELSYADAAVMVGGHLDYQIGTFDVRMLAVNWSLEGKAAENAGKSQQYGVYAELSWRPLRKFGAFVRQSAWSLEEDFNVQQTDLGFNYFPLDNVVIKADIGVQNESSERTNLLNLGMGYQF